MMTVEGQNIRVTVRDEYRPCGAELAECSCPDDCERDHGNE